MFPGQSQPEATVQVEHPECFETIAATAQALALKYGVSVKYVSPKKPKAGYSPVARFMFHGAPASKCGKAA
jgi:hypothetical protein